MREALALVEQRLVEFLEWQRDQQEKEASS
jgi:hypothetical protein